MRTSTRVAGTEPLLVTENPDLATRLDRLDAARLVGAALLAVSAGLHLRLFLGGYRDIHLRDVLGLDLAGSFALAVVSGVVVASLLVASVLYERGARLIAAAGVAYALGALAAYALTRTTGFLGFEETRWVPEAVVAKPTEVAACVVLVLAARRRRMPPATVSPTTP